MNETVADPLAEAALAHGELALLEEIRDALQASVINLGVSNHVQQPITVADFPVQGAQRWVLPRIATGGRFEAPEGVGKAIVLLRHNAARLGGTIVNVGEKEATIILSGEKEAGGAALAQIGLVPGGGSWDLRLGNLPWCGSISAFGVGGATFLTVAEV